MAENKKSFILYCDTLHTVSKLPDEKAGQLFKHILSYVNDENPVTDDLIIQVAFEPIKQQLKRDLVKWDEIRSKRSEAGKASAAKRQQVSTSVQDVQQCSTNSTVNDNVNVTVNVNDNVKITNTDKELLLRNRAQDFSETLKPYLGKYGSDMLNAFYSYWTEPNKSKTKMRFELEKTWDTERRLNTWASREKPQGKPQSTGKDISDYQKMAGYE